MRSCSELSYLMKCQDPNLVRDFFSLEKLMSLLGFANADTVRGLAVMPDLGFLSASHDG